MTTKSDYTPQEWELLQKPLLMCWVSVCRASFRSESLRKSYRPRHKSTQACAIPHGETEAPIETWVERAADGPLANVLC